MNIIDRSALSIARAIRNNYPDAGSEIALKYTLSLLINSFSAIVITLCICLMTDHVIQGITVIFSYTLLRIVSGGAHMPTSLSCCITSIVLFTVIAHLPFEYSYIHIFLDLVSIYILFLKAPEGIENVSSIDRKYYPLLKAISICLVASSFYFQSSLLSFAFFAQAIFLTNFAYKAINFIERRMVA